MFWGFIYLFGSGSVPACAVIGKEAWFCSNHWAASIHSTQCRIRSKTEKIVVALAEEKQCSLRFRTELDYICVS